MTSTASVARPGTLCAASRRDGGVCCAYACSGSAYCAFHDPEKALERKAWRSAGGRARHGRSLKTSPAGDQAVNLGSVADVVQLLESAVRDLLTLENSISRARAVGYVCGVAVKALEVSDLESRIAALERQVGV